MTDMEDFGKNGHINETKLKVFVGELIKLVKEDTDIDKLVNKLRSKYKCLPKKSEIRYIYEKYFINEKIPKNLARFMIKKAVRSRSGVLVSTIVLRPDVFSCPKKCSYCPTETDLDGNPTQPKSYLSTEPAMLRALQYNFDVKGQLWDRIRAYIKTGNITQNEDSYKLEIILSGGTWESYPYDYRNQVMKEIYWAANTYDEERKIKKLEEEIEINENAKYRIIGLTIETRPDFITNYAIKNYRRWGVTRVQIGVQHYDENILKKINRECTTQDTIKAIKKLKQCGFKVVCHLMPDLPGSSPELDKWMFDQAIHNPDLQFDDVKVYPTAVCQSDNPNIIVKSDISEWYKQGIYTPYAEKNLRDLIDVLKYYKTNIQPWVRIQRLIRDIPKQSIEAGYERISNLRQIIQNEMKKEGTQCRCIRCMEVGDDDEEIENATLKVREYDASGGKEYFISYEKEKLVGFCRLRLDKNAGGGIFKELENSALIREVHVYGHSLGIGGNGHSTQHRGYGRQLVKKAEEIAYNNGYRKIAVIAGVGTREYYKNKCGYRKEGTYMVKDLRKTSWVWYGIIVLIFLFIINESVYRLLPRYENS